MKQLTAVEILQKLERNDRDFIAELSLIIEGIARKWNWTNTDSIEDIAQESFARLLTNLRNGKFKGESSLKTYVYAIIRNTCIDRYKLSVVMETTDLDSVSLVDSGPLPDTDLINKEQRRTACRVLLALPEQCRQLWRTIFFGKKNYRQAAEILGLTEGTVKRRMWECRRIARDMVKAYEN